MSRWSEMVVHSSHLLDFLPIRIDNPKARLRAQNVDGRLKKFDYENTGAFMCAWCGRWWVVTQLRRMFLTRLLRLWSGVRPSCCCRGNGTSGRKLWGFVMMGSWDEDKRERGEVVWNLRYGVEQVYFCFDTVPWDSLLFEMLSKVDE